MDYFALLDQPRRPWLDAAALKARFLALSADAHPDRVHGAAPSEKDAANQRFAEVSAAYNCLRDAKDRLAHLIELETGRRPAAVQQSPAGVEDLFFAIAPAAQRADRLLQQKSKAASPLARAALYADGLELSAKLMDLQGLLNARREKLEVELRQVDGEWPAAPALDHVARLYAEFSFLKRWSEQVQDRVARLAE